MRPVYDNALPPEFYARDPVSVARELLGKLLLRRDQSGICGGRIVEVEAYLHADDPACHSARGINRKNASMFGPAGRAYVYTIHARQCFNVVTDTATVGSAVLIRAVEPLTGLRLMCIRRRTQKLRDLCRGPARLTEAMNIGRSLDGWSLAKNRRLWIAGDRTAADVEIRSSPRIGVTSAHALPLRFFIAGSEFVSGTRKFNGTP